MRDLHHALRALARRPGFTLITAATLALGIGASVAVFSLVRDVLLRPLPYGEPERLVALFSGVPGSDQRNPTAPGRFADWKEGGGSFERMTAAHPWSPVLTGNDRPEQLAALRSSPELFELLQVPAAVGRTFEPGDGSAVVVLGDGLWRRRFAGDPGVIGRTLTLDGEPHTVIGVMPPGFEFPPFWATGAQLWAPLEIAEEDWTDRRAAFLRVFARLRPGVELSAARAEMDALGERLAAAFPDTDDPGRIRVEPLLEPVVTGARTPLAVLAAAVGCMLAVACINVAALLLARAVSREREVALRTALGAGRGRLLAALLIESLLLAVLGGAGGLLLAVWAVEALVRLAPDGLPRVTGATVDLPMLAAAVAVAVLAALAASAAPALGLMRRDPAAGLRLGGARSGGPRLRGRQALVAAQVALALVLLTGAGLLVRSLLRLGDLDPGFSGERLWTATVALAGSPHAEPERQLALFERLVAEVETLPGVERAAVVNHLPVGGDVWSTAVAAEGREAGTETSAVFRVAGTGYFETLQIPVLDGRPFDRSDRAGGLPVVIVNQTLARELWPDREAVGRRVRLGSAPDEPWRTVVGVAADVRQYRLTDAIRPEVYYPYSQNPTPWWQRTSLVVRTAGDPLAAGPAITDRVAGVDPDLPLADVRSGGQILHDQLQRQRLLAWLLGVFAATTLVLAAVGLYGVMSYMVRLRRRELGVRLALGAVRRDVLWALAGRALALAAAGIAIGGLGSVLVGRALSGLLHGLPAIDPVSYAAAIAVLGAAVGLASWLPARRAAQIDPLEALREE